MSESKKTSTSSSSAAATSTEGSKLKRLAKEGDLDAQFRLAKAYLDSKEADRVDGITKNLKEGKKWLESAIEKGHVDSMWYLCRCYDKGAGVDQNYAEAARVCQQAADAGHLKAKFETGLYFKKGRGVAKNLAEAVRYWEEAALAGEPRAMSHLAHCYKKGNGVEQSHDKAFKLYERAAKKKHAEAEYNLALCYRSGLGCKKNHMLAVKYFRMAAQRGYSTEFSESFVLEAKQDKEGGSDASSSEESASSSDDEEAPTKNVDIVKNLQALTKTATNTLTAVPSRPVYENDWDNWQADPDKAHPWNAERDVLLLLLESRVLLREMVERKLKAERTARGNLSMGEISDLLNSQNEDSETDWIAEIQELKRALIAEVRQNHVMERDLGKLDKRIALLIKNRGDITKDVGGGKREKKVVREGTALLSDPRKLESYEHLFYLLQTEPKYLAGLVFMMDFKQMTQFLDIVILALFGSSFSPREEYLLLQLFSQAIQKEIQTCKKPSQFIGSESVVPKMLVNYTKRDNSIDYLSKLVVPVVKDVMTRDNLNLELKPVEVYKKMITDEETKTGKKSKRDRGLGEEKVLEIDEVKQIIAEREATLIAICDDFVNRVFASLKRMPYGVRWICKTIRALTEVQFPDESEQVYLTQISYFAYYRFINLALTNPKSFDLVEDDPDLFQTKNLTAIGKVVLTLFNFTTFSSKADKAYFGCNKWITSRMEEVIDFFHELVQVEEPDEHLRVDRYMELTQEAKPQIIISTDEIAQTHKHLADNLKNLAKDKNDPLRLILAELGDAPDHNQFGDREIQLTLTNKFKQELEDDVSASSALYAKTKEQVIHILRAIPMAEAEKANGGQELTLLKMLDFARGWGKSTGNNDIATDVKKILKNLESLEQEKFVSKVDEYAGFVRDVALEVANRAEIREQQRKEIKRLTQTLRNLRKHKKYLEERIAHYEGYLNECRQRHYGGGKAGAKGKKGDVVFKYSFRELQKKGIIVESTAPTLVQKGIKFEVSQNPEAFGSFFVTAFVAGKEHSTSTIELDELLERNYNNIATIDLEEIVLDVNLTINWINRMFAAGKK